MKFINLITIGVATLTCVAAYYYFRPPIIKPVSDEWLSDQDYDKDGFLP